MEVTRLIPDYGFTTLGLHRIELTAYVTNPAAIKAYEKAGYHMKVLRDSLVFVMVNSLIKFKCRYYHMSG
jgi:RimJ/RimL family protein N-acetyltransferase